MKIRTAYFKVDRMEPALAFWRELLGMPPAKTSPRWAEFRLGDVRLGFLLNDFGEEISGNSCVPVLEFDVDELTPFIERAKALGATVVIDGLENPTMNSIVLAAPTGHEFELCRCHD